MRVKNKLYYIRGAQSARVFSEKSSEVKVTPAVNNDQRPLFRAGGKSFFSIYLTELRYRALYLFFSFSLTFFMATTYSSSLIYLMCTPFLKSKVHFIFTQVTEGLYAALDVSILCALSFCAPLFVYQLYSFFMPSSYQGQRLLVHFFIFLTAFLFLLSFYIALFILLPKIWAFLQQFQQENKSLEIQLTASLGPAVRWVCTTLFFTVLFFQIPVLVALSLYWGVIDGKVLQKKRKYAFFFSLLLASLLSPPDVFSQSTLALGGVLFYELIFWFALYHLRWCNGP